MGTYNSDDLSNKWRFINKLAILIIIGAFLTIYKYSDCSEKLFYGQANRYWISILKALTDCFGICYVSGVIGKLFSLINIT